MHLCLSCPSRQGDLGEGHVVIVNGISSTSSSFLDKALMQKAGRPIKRFSLEARYMPNETTPAALKYPQMEQRVNRLAELVSQSSHTGSIPLIDLHDPWHALVHPLATLLSLDHRVTTVLLYSPLAQIVSSPPTSEAALVKQLGSLLEHSYLFTGTPTKKPESIEYLSRKDLNNVLKKFKGFAEKLTSKEQAASMANHLFEIVPTALGFTSSVLTGVYLRPRRAYDQVVQVTSQQPIYGLWQHLVTLRHKARPSVTLQEPAGWYTELPICERCAQGTTADRMRVLMHPTMRLTNGHQLCSQCLELAQVMLNQPIPKLWQCQGPKVKDALVGFFWAPPSPSKPTRNKSLSPPAEMLTGTLENGFSYVVLPNMVPGDMFVAYLQVNAGSVNETDSQQGMAHMLEHMVFQGTEKYESEEVMTNLYNAMGMSFGADANAYTSYRQTVFSFICTVGKTDVSSLLGDQPQVSAEALQYLLGTLLGSSFAQRQTRQRSTMQSCRTCKAGSCAQGNKALPKLARRQFGFQVTRTSEGDRALRIGFRRHKSKGFVDTNIAKKQLRRGNVPPMLRKLKANTTTKGEEEGMITLDAFLKALSTIATKEVDPIETEVYKKISQINVLIEELENCDDARAQEIEELLNMLLMDPDVMEEFGAPPEGGGTSNMELVLDILCQMAFYSTFPSEGFDAERRAVLSEMSLRGTLSLQITQEEQEQLFPGSVLNDRQPIGKKHIIEGWTLAEVKEFYDKWYFPGNMCLYVVGNVNPQRTAKRIEKIFGGVAPKYAVRAPFNHGGYDPINFNALLHETKDPLAFGLPLYKMYPKTAKGFVGQEWPLLKIQKGWQLPLAPVVKYRDLADPPQQPEIPNDITHPPIPFKSYLHPSNATFSLALQCRAPLTSMLTADHIKLVLLDTLVMLAWQHRRAYDLEADWKTPFMSMAVMNGVSSELNAGIVSVVMECRPSQWKEGITTCIKELKRLYTHGLTRDELEFQLRTLEGSLGVGAGDTSDKLVEVIMEAVGLRSVFVSSNAEVQIFYDFQKEVTLDQINQRIKYVFGPLLTHTGKHGASISCAFCTVPLFYEYDEVLEVQYPGVRSKLPKAQTEVELINIWKSTGDESAKPLRPINLEDDDVKEVLHAALQLDDPPPFQMPPVPETLMTTRDIGTVSGVTIQSEHHVLWMDAHLCRLSNGLAFNYKTMPALAEYAVVRLSWGYGYAWMEKKSEDPTLALSVLMSSGAWKYSQEQINAYAALHGISLDANVSEKTFNILATGPTFNNGLTKLLMIMFMYWMHHKYDPNALQRKKLELMMESVQNERTIDMSALFALYDVVFGHDPRFTSLGLADIAAVELSHMKEIFQKFLHPGNAELVVLGDFDPEKLKSEVIRIFGNVPQDPSWKPPPAPKRSLKLACINCFAAMGCPRPALGTEMGDGTAGAVVFDKLNRGNTARFPSQHPTALPSKDAGTITSTRGGWATALPRKSKVITEDGPIPSLGNLKLCARVKVREDMPRGMVYILMPWPNSSGEFPVEAGGVRFQTPLLGDGFHSSSFPLDGQWSRAEIISHPRYAHRCMHLLGLMLENRLFRKIRSELGLCYTISFQAAVTAEYDMGWSLVAANAFQDDRRINVMVLEIVKVMQNLVDSLTQDEFDAAKVPLIQESQALEMSLETWMERLSDIQLPHSSGQTWLSAELTSYLEALTLDDVISVARQKYFPTDENLYVSIGQSVSENVEVSIAASVGGMVMPKGNGTGMSSRPRSLPSPLRTPIAGLRSSGHAVPSLSLRQAAHRLGPLDLGSGQKKVSKLPL